MPGESNILYISNILFTLKYITCTLDWIIFVCATWPKYIAYSKFNHITTPYTSIDLEMQLSNPSSKMCHWRLNESILKHPESDANLKNYRNFFHLIQALWTRNLHCERCTKNCVIVFLHSPFHPAKFDEFMSSITLPKFILTSLNASVTMEELAAVFTDPGPSPAWTLQRSAQKGDTPCTIPPLLYCRHT